MPQVSTKINGPLASLGDEARVSKRQKVFCGFTRQRSLGSGGGTGGKARDESQEGTKRAMGPTSQAHRFEPSLCTIWVSTQQGVL